MSVKRAVRRRKSLGHSEAPVSHQSVIKLRNKVFFCIHAETEDLIQACKLSMTAYHSANQSVSALPFLHPCSQCSSCFKEQSVLDTNTLFVKKVYMLQECVLNINEKMHILVLFFVVVFFLSLFTFLGFSHFVFFNYIVSRLFLFVTAARGAPFSDTHADQRKMGRLGAGGEICDCKIPHPHSLEVSP